MPNKPPIHKPFSNAEPNDYLGIRKLRSSKRWQDVRELKLSLNPLCEICQLNNLVVSAEQVHHIEPLEKRIDLAFDLTNLQSLCTACHSELEQRYRTGK